LRRQEKPPAKCTRPSETSNLNTNADRSDEKRWCGGHESLVAPPHLNGYILKNDGLAWIGVEEGEAAGFFRVSNFYFPLHTNQSQLF